MASYKSQRNPLQRGEDRVLTTRLPQRSVTPTTITSQSHTASQHSVLKRRPTRDEQVYSGRELACEQSPVQRAGSHQGSAGFAIPISSRTSSTQRPRPSPQSSTSRLPRLEVPSSIRTPSLASGSSASTIESPRSNVLKRKQPNVGIASSQQALRTRDDSMSSQEDRQLTEGIPGGYKDPFSETVLGISLPPSSSILAQSEYGAEGFRRSQYDYEIGPTDTLPLPIPQYALSATPSTRYTASPAFSIASTPTSMSSYSSPGFSSTKTSARLRQASPLQSRPPVTRHRTPEEIHVRTPPGLSTVRESSTSSSSTSTVKAESGKHNENPSSNRLLPSSQGPSTHSTTQNVVEQPRSQAPPELAHLADSSLTSPPKPRRPSRPSRDGTPELVGLRDPWPVIQSNMVSFPSPHKRTGSTDSKFGIVTAAKSRVGIPPKPSSRLPSPNPASRISSTSRGSTRGPTPDNQTYRDPRRSSTIPAPAPMPNPSKTSRFGFFTRRAKTEPALPAVRPESKLHRRGPVAGTGHEGYGRYAFRGRSGSSVSTTSIGRSVSAGNTSESLDHTPSTRKSSLTSTTSAEMDDFLLHRLAPVVIRGTGSSTELTRSPEPMQSTSSLDVSVQPNPTSKTASIITTQSAIEKNQPTLLPSAMPDTTRGESPTKKMQVGLGMLSDSDDDYKRSFPPTTTSKPTSRASKVMVRPSVSGGVASGRTVEKAHKSYVADLISDGKEVKWLKSSKKTKSEKDQAKPSKRWNFFQRAHATPRVETPAADVATDMAQVSLSRSVAHYAPSDAQGVDLEDLEQLMKEAVDEGTESALSDNESTRKERMQSMLLPPKPILPAAFAPPARPASPKVFLRPEAQLGQQHRKLTIDTDFKTTERRSILDLTPFTDLSPPSSPMRKPSPMHDAPSPQSAPVCVLASPPQLESLPSQSPPSPGPPPVSPPPRPSRLPQVGRIPQVVSSRRQPHQPSSRSFSRPFVAEKPRPTVPPRTSFDSIGSVFATAGAIESYPVLHGLNALSHASAIATMSSPSEDSGHQSEFFKFPSRKDSEVSYSSSSGTWNFPPAADTAVVPSSAAPLSEDELWNEYDDLIDEVLSPVSPSKDDTLTRSQPSSLEPLPLATKDSHSSLRPGSLADEVSNPSLHLRRSRLLAVLHSAQSPTSSLSLSEFIQDYGERKISVVDPVTGRLSLPASPRLSTGSTTKRSIRSSLPASLTLSERQSRATFASKSDKDRYSTGTNRPRDSRLMEVAETQADGLVSMANLRFGALMTSKWLSFGRVLFSPVHFQLKDSREDRVLVIDGLGKDWSYYCALTYPEAAVYDIGPGPSTSTAPTSDTPEPWSTLPNHRHICHDSLTTAFPYPMNFFACVVLRFPSALPSSVHRFLLSEARRVLRPGGYLEFSVLDLDLVNMGNRARRAVRGLKMRIKEVDDNISLRNISDEIMAGLGRKGFTECNRCVVGVPVAGKLPVPEDSTFSGKKKMSSKTKTPGPKPELSFSDLLNGSSQSESTDVSIADMVARVGRWWYSRCYESIVLPEAQESEGMRSGNILENSIWRDEALITECEKRGTSFRMLIGYAQKPEVDVRRTVSV